MKPQEQRALSSELQPADRETFGTELTACLALVVPVGMSEEARREWLSVAWITLQHLPPDLLARGCKVAREKCDHPSKIVPTVLEATAEEMRWRRNHAPSSYVSLPAPTQRHVMDRRGEPMSQEDTNKLNDILENLGALARYRPDGSKYMLDQP